MGRNRKPLDQQIGHLTVKQQQIIEQSEQLTDVGNEEFVIVPDWLIDKTAKSEYARLSQLLSKASIAGNLDVNNLSVYCNAYATYRKLIRAIKKITPQVTDPESGDICVNPEFERMTAQISKYTDIMLKYSGKLGLTIDSRLKSGAIKSNKVQDKINEAFGDI